jgi:4-amino-4-deoxy-L-arabinose transferase and related glycosyltransferases of PMT family
VAVALGATATRYGYHRDELYFRMLEPAWGYVDQPPLTPLLARTATALFGDSVWALRLPAIACPLGSVLLAVLVTRELGGGRGAQALCAWGLAFSALPLTFGHTLLTASLDLVVWTAVLLLATRALRRGEPRWWLAIGAVVGLSLANKHLVVLLLIGLAAGLVAVGPREVFRSPWLWAGVGLALVLALPNLVYQATHDWPQLTMARALSERGGSEARTLLLPLQFVLLGFGLVPIWVAGFLALLRRPAWRPVRALALAYPVVLVIALVTAGQFYYPLGLVVALFAAGCVPTAEWFGQRIGRRALVVAAVAVNGALSAVMALPLVPIGALGDTPIPDVNQVARDTVGWPVYVQTVAEVYASLPPEDRARAVLFTSNYGEAGALHRYGPAYGLPAVYSGHNELWFAGPPPESATVVVAWVQGVRAFSTLFAECEQRAVLDNGVGVDNEEQEAAVAVCRDPVGGWSAIWPRLQHYD